MIHGECRGGILPPRWFRANCELRVVIVKQIIAQRRYVANNDASTLWSDDGSRQREIFNCTMKIHFDLDRFAGVYLLVWFLFIYLYRAIVADNATINRRVTARKGTHSSSLRKKKTHTHTSTKASALFFHRAVECATEQEHLRTDQTENDVPNDVNDSRFGVMDERRMHDRCTKQRGHTREYAYVYASR